MNIVQTDILISGGGIAGLSLAILLGQAGLSVGLIEPFLPPALKKVKPSGRSVALMNSSVNILRACGDVWDVIEPFSCPMEVMRIIDISRAVEDSIKVEFPANDVGAAQFGYNIPNGVLRAALYEAAQAQDNITLFKAALEDYRIEPSHVMARLEGGTEIRASLIVGADGRASKVREIAGIETKKTQYDQVAITCLINHSRPHENASSEFHKPHGPLAFVPMPGGHQSSVVWVERPERAQEIMALKKGAFEQLLMERSEELLGGITLEADAESWPLCSIKAKALSGARMVLMAEAAHVMSPITAQGLNLSLRDVAGLAEVLVDAVRLGLDIGSKPVLDGYVKRRRLDIDTRVFGVHSLNMLVSSERKALKNMRRTGLKALAAFPALKSFAMRSGLNVDFDSGRLMRGEGL